MSLLLKFTRNSTRTVRNITCILQPQTRFIHFNLVKRQANTMKIVDTLKESNGRVSRVTQTSLAALTNDLSRLDKEIDELNKASNIMSKGSELMENIDSRYLMLSPKDKTQKLNEIWSKIKSGSEIIKFEHYFTYLKLLLNQPNEINIEQIEALINEISHKDIESHPQINELKFKAYCLNGSLDKAQTLLSYMKEKNLSVNDDIFNSLIVCYLNNSKEREAEQIYEMMIHRNLKPNYDTFRGIFNYYLIRNKNLDKFNLYFDRMQSLDSVRVYTIELFRLVADCAHYKMSIDDLIQVLNKMNLKLNQSQVISNTLKVLLQNSRSQEALKLLNYAISHYEKILEMNQQLQKEQQSATAAPEGLSIDEEARFIIESKSDTQLKDESDKVIHDLFEHFSNAFLKSSFDMSLLTQATDAMAHTNLVKLFDSLLHNACLNGNIQAAMSIIRLIGERELYTMIHLRSNHIVPIFLQVMRSQDLNLFKEFVHFRQLSFLKRIPFTLDEPRELSYFNRCSLDFLKEVNKYLLENDDEELISFKMNYFSAQLFEVATDKRHKSGELLKDLDLYKLFEYSYAHLDTHKDLSDMLLLNKMFSFRIKYPIEILMTHLFKQGAQLENKNDITDLISQKNLESFLSLLHLIFTHGTHRCQLKIMNQLQQFYTNFTSSSSDQHDSSRSKFMCDILVKANLKLGQRTDLNILKVPSEYYQQLLFANDQYVKDVDAMLKVKREVEQLSWNEDEISEMIKMAKSYQEDTQFLKLKLLLINLNKLKDLKNTKPDDELTSKIDKLLSSLKNSRFIFDRKTLLQLIDYYLDVKSDIKLATKLFEYCVSTEGLVDSFFDANIILGNYKSEYFNKIAKLSKTQPDKLVESLVKNPELSKDMNLIDVLLQHDDLTKENVNLSKLIDTYVAKGIAQIRKDFTRLVKNNKINTSIEIVKRSINSMDSFDLPHFDLLYQLIATEKLDDLQEYIDFLIEHKPQEKNRVYNDLFATLIRHGHIDKARFIGEHQPDFSFEPMRVWLNASHLYTQKEYEKLHTFVQTLKTHFNDVILDFSLFDHLLVKASLKQNQTLDENFMSNLNDFNREFLHLSKTNENPKKLSLYRNLFEFLNDYATLDESKISPKLKDKYVAYMDAHTRFLYYQTQFNKSKTSQEKVDLLQKIAKQGDYETLERFSLRQETREFNYCRFELAIAYSMHENKLDSLIQMIQKDYNFMPYYFIAKPMTYDSGDKLEDEVFDKVANKIGIDSLMRLFEECPKSNADSLVFRNLAKKFARHFIQNDNFVKYQEFVDQYKLFEINFQIGDLIQDAFKKNKMERVDRIFESCHNNKILLVLSNKYFVTALDNAQDLDLIKQRLNYIKEKYGFKLKDLQPTTLSRLRAYFLVNGDNIDLIPK